MVNVAILSGSVSITSSAKYIIQDQVFCLVTLH